MKRLAGAVLGVIAGCATVGEPVSGPQLARIAALEDARTTNDGELLTLLQHGDPRVRERCATALGRMWFPEHGAETTRALLGALSDRDAGVRAAAAFALGMRGDPSAADKLLFVALDHHERDAEAIVRARAIEAASKLDRPELRERVLDALLDADPRLRLEAAQGAGRWSTTEAGATAVNQRLVEHVASERDPGVVTYALFALERRKASEALATFVRYSTSRDAEQRLFAVRGLKALAADPATLGHLWRASTDGDARIACEACLALGGASDDGSLAYLAAATRHANPNVRRCAWEAIGAAAQRRPEALRELARIGVPLDVNGWNVPLEEPSAWVRGSICEARVRALVHDPAPEESLSALGGVYSALEREARSGAIRGLAALDEERAVPVLLECIKDPDFAVGGVAIEMLAKFPGPVVRGALHEVLRFEDNGLRLAAVTALAELPDASDLEPLTQCFDSSTGDGANEIRFNALRAAGKIGGEGALSLLMKGLLDESAFVRRVAREELGKLDPSSRQRGDALDLGPQRPIVALDLPRYDANPVVEVRTTHGALRFELFPDEAPLHVHNFLTLAARDHYDGTLWHRVVSDFVIQGGDYRGDGNGGGTWRGRGDSLRHEISPRKYVRGSLGMPRNEDPDSGGSQLFVTHRATPHLDGRYTIFGELREGFEVLDTIGVGDRILDVTRLR